VLAVAKSFRAAETPLGPSLDRASAFSHRPRGTHRKRHDTRPGAGTSRLVRQKYQARAPRGTHPSHHTHHIVDTHDAGSIPERSAARLAERAHAPRNRTGAGGLAWAEAQRSERTTTKGRCNPHRRGVQCQSVCSSVVSAQWREGVISLCR